MPSPRGFRRDRTTGPRRKTGWEEGVGGTGVLAIGATGSFFLGSAVAPTVDGLTLVRTRGFVEMLLAGATARGDGMQGAIGIGVTTVAAVAAGIASVPTPIDELDWDGWLYHQLFSIHSQGAGVASSSNSVLRMPVESKAMRKLDLLDSIYAAIQVAEIGGGPMDVFLDTRMLLKLP